MKLIVSQSNPAKAPPAVASPPKADPPLAEAEVLLDKGEKSFSSAGRDFFERNTSRKNRVRSRAPDSARTTDELAGAPRRSPQIRILRGRRSPQPVRLSPARILRLFAHPILLARKRSRKILERRRLVRGNQAVEPLPRANPPRSLEKISFPAAIRAESNPRNPGIPGMGKPGQGFQARDRVGPIHGIPRISRKEARGGGRNFFLSTMVSTAEGSFPGLLVVSRSNDRRHVFECGTRLRVRQSREAARREILPRFRRK